MFELPEVEIVRRELERDIINRKIKTAEAVSLKVLKRYRTRNAFTSKLIGNKIVGLRRVGLHILIDLSNETSLVVDLGSSGSLRRKTNRAAVAEGTEVMVGFTQFGQLHLIDASGTSEMFVAQADATTEEITGIEKLGFDPLMEPVAWAFLGKQLSEKQSRLKTLLTDPSFVVGIGDIYADEILYHAGLRHNRMSDTLTSQEIRRLHRSLVGTLHEAIKYRGTSVPAREFVDPKGEHGEYGSHLMVWGKDGELSARSRLPIQKVKFKGTWTYYCQTQV